MTPKRFAISGAGGKMGTALIRKSIDYAEELELVACIHRSAATIKATTDEYNHSDDVGVAYRQAPFDVLIDFTSPTASIEQAQFCSENGIALVVGTTGFSVDHEDEIRRFSQQIPIVLAPNMSVGVNLCFHLLQKMTETCGDFADVEIVESHHRLKKDAPSGTALKMGQVVAKARGQSLSEAAVYDRSQRSQPRSQKEIGFSSIRGGSVIGEHQVTFSFGDEQIALSHRAFSREIYAEGALKAAVWVLKKDNGLFDMKAVMGLC